MRGQHSPLSVHTALPCLVLKGPLKGHPQRDSGPSGPAPRLISAGAAPTQSHRLPAVTRIARFHRHLAPVHNTLHSRMAHTRGPPLASQIFSCPQSTSGMAAGGAFPELSLAAHSWLSPLQPLLQVPTPPASWLSQAHPLIPTSGLHAPTMESPQRTQAWPCSPTPGLPSAIFHSWR